MRSEDVTKGNISKLIRRYKKLLVEQLVMDGHEILCGRPDSDYGLTKYWLKCTSDKAKEDIN